MSCLLIPIRLEFRYNSYKHSEVMENLIIHNQIQLRGNIKAFASDLPQEEILEQLRPELLLWISRYSGYGVTLDDFTLTYSLDQIENGRVWASGSVVRMHRFGRGNEFPL
jgi:hypothetical protein